MFVLMFVLIYISTTGSSDLNNTETCKDFSIGWNSDTFTINKNMSFKVSCSYSGSIKYYHLEFRDMKQRFTNKGIWKPNHFLIDGKLFMEDTELLLSKRSSELWLDNRQLKLDNDLKEIPDFHFSIALNFKEPKFRIYCTYKESCPTLQNIECKFSPFCETYFKITNSSNLNTTIVGLHINKIQFTNITATRQWQKMTVIQKIESNQPTYLEIFVEDRMIYYGYHKEIPPHIIQATSNIIGWTHNCRPSDYSVPLSVSGYQNTPADSTFYTILVFMPLVMSLIVMATFYCFVVKLRQIVPKLQ